MTVMRGFPLKLIATLSLFALAWMPRAVQAQVPPEQIPPALAAAVTADQQAAGTSTGSVYVGDCSAPNPPNTPGRCSTVDAIQNGYAKVIIGRVGAEGVGTYLYQQSGSSWVSRGLVAENAPFPPAAPPAPPATGNAPATGLESVRGLALGAGGLLIATAVIGAALLKRRSEL
jgi:hypothetical protein